MPETTLVSRVYNAPEDFGVFLLQQSVILSPLVSNKMSLAVIMTDTFGIKIMVDSIYPLPLLGSSCVVEHVRRHHGNDMS